MSGDEFDHFEGQLQRRQGLVRGFLSSTRSALIQTGASTAMVIASGRALMAGTWEGVVAASMTRLVLELWNNGVLHHLLTPRGRRFWRHVEAETGPDVPNGPSTAEAFRHAMAALDETVYPALTRLLAEYCKCPPDAFFRSVGTVLSALDADGLAGLDSLLTVVLNELDDEFERSEWACFEVQWNGSATPLVRVGLGSPNNIAFQEAVHADAVHVERWQQLSAQLLSAGVVSGPPGGLKAGSWFNPNTLERLHRIVRG